MIKVLLWQVALVFCQPHGELGEKCTITYQKNVYNDEAICKEGAQIMRTNYAKYTWKHDSPRLKTIGCELVSFDIPADRVVPSIASDAVE